MTDVFIVGGGPAGLAAAIAARNRGFSVVVADSSKPPIDKACGEGLMPDSLEALQALGMDLDGITESHPFRGIRFLGADSLVAATFPTGEGIGLRRTVLHQLMADRAAAIGVNLRWGTNIEDLDAIKARWIIGADGQKSRVRQWAGLDATRRESKRYGFSRHYRLAPWADYVEVYWASECQMYVTPVAPDEV
jgi:flavin-dependent dehydrogenase